MTSTRDYQLLPPLITSTGWYFRNYLIRYDAAELIDPAVHDREVRRLANDIPNSFTMPDYEYYRLGFIVSHYGRRGICVSIWHWGQWHTTNEMFNQCWYTFGRDHSALTIQDRREPIMCVHEIRLLTQELALFQEIASSSSAFSDSDAFMKFTPSL